MGQEGEVGTSGSRSGADGFSPARPEKHTSVPPGEVTRVVRIIWSVLMIHCRDVYVTDRPLQSPFGSLIFVSCKTGGDTKLFFLHFANIFSEK